MSGLCWGKTQSAYMKITPLLTTRPPINSRVIRPYYDEAKRDVYFESCVMWTWRDALRGIFRVIVVMYLVFLDDHTDIVFFLHV